MSQSDDLFIALAGTVYKFGVYNLTANMHPCQCNPVPQVYSSLGSWSIHNTEVGGQDHLQNQGKIERGDSREWFAGGV